MRKGCWPNSVKARQVISLKVWENDRCHQELENRFLGALPRSECSHITKFIHKVTTIWMYIKQTMISQLLPGEKGCHFLKLLCGSHVQIWHDVNSSAHTHTTWLKCCESSPLLCMPQCLSSLATPKKLRLVGRQRSPFRAGQIFFYEFFFCNTTFLAS